MDQELSPTVTCRLCGKVLVRGIGKMLGHLASNDITHYRTKKIKYNKETYLAKFGKVAEEDFLIPASEQAKHLSEEKLLENKTRIQSVVEGTYVPKKDLPDERSFMERMRDQLTTSERSEFDQQFELIFQQVDRDETQSARVSTYVFYQIQLNRLLEEQMRPGYRYSKDHEAAVKDTETRIRALASDLGISREQRLKNRAQVKSTPAAMFSGYVDLLMRFSPETLDTLRHEEDKALAECQAQLQTYFDAAPDRKSYDEEEENDGPIDVAELVRRAGVSI